MRAVNGHGKWQVLVDLSVRLWSIYLAALGCVALGRGVGVRVGHGGDRGEQAQGQDNARDLEKSLHGAFQVKGDGGDTGCSAWGMRAVPLTSTLWARPLDVRSNLPQPHGEGPVTRELPG